MFKVRCGSQASVAVSEAVRLHLELTEAAAADCLAAVAALGTELTDVQTCSLELPARLLLHTRPPQFASFRRYARWRELMAAPLLLFGKAHGCGAEGLARLKGRLRQLAIEDAADFCAPVYGEFCDATFSVVSSLAGQARQVPGAHLHEDSQALQPLACKVACWRRDGWALPFHGRVLLARMLLGALFGAEDGASLAGSGMGLPGLLERAVWPQLGVPQQTHECLLAWVHFVEFMRHPGARPGLVGRCVLAVKYLCAGCRL